MSPLSSIPITVINESSSDKSNASSCVLIETTTSSVETKNEPDKVKILANLEDNDDDDDEWS